MESQISHYVSLVSHLKNTPLPPDSLLHSLNNASNVLVALLRTVQHGAEVHFPHLSDLTGSKRMSDHDGGNNAYGEDDLLDDDPGVGPAWLSAVLECCGLGITFKKI